MATRTRLPCRHRGCAALVSEPGYCEDHKHEAPSRQADKHRGSSSERGYDYRWQQFRARWLADHPLCAECQRQDRVTAATDVDHIIPHRGDKEKFWAGPFQSLCGPCHKAKTGRGE